MVHHDYVKPTLLEVHYYHKPHIMLFITIFGWKYKKSIPYEEKRLVNGLSIIKKSLLLKKRIPLCLQLFVYELPIYHYCSCL